MYFKLVYNAKLIIPDQSTVISVIQTYVVGQAYGCDIGLRFSKVFLLAAFFFRGSCVQPHQSQNTSLI